MLSKQEIKWATEAINDAQNPSKDPSTIVGALSWAAKVIDSHEELRAALAGLKCQNPTINHEIIAGPNTVPCGECAPCRAREL